MLPLKRANTPNPASGSRAGTRGRGSLEEAGASVDARRVLMSKTDVLIDSEAPIDL